jgi:hypothetical protein
MGGNWGAGPGAGAGADVCRSERLAALERCNCWYTTALAKYVVRISAAVWAEIVVVYLSSSRWMFQWQTALK